MNDAALAALKRTLLPPLRFAARDDFARVERLLGFSALVDRALDNAGSTVPAAIAAALRKLSADFDEADAAVRAARVRYILQVLGEGDDAKTTSPPQPTAARQAKAAPERAGVIAEETPAVVTPAKPNTRAKRAARTRSSPVAASAAPAPPAASSDSLSWPVSSIPGVGDRRAKQLSERNLSTVGGLLAFLPRTYEDRKRCPLGSLVAGAHVVVQGEITASVIVGRGRGTRLELLIEDDTGRCKLVFFHRGISNMQQRFAVGREVGAQGEVRALPGPAAAQPAAYSPR